MTDRYNYLIVALEKDMREDDAETLIAAIKTMRNVLDVRGNVSGSGDWWIAEERARRELADKLLAILYPNKSG